MLLVFINELPYLSGSITRDFAEIVEEMLFENSRN